jgi:hypothetical protein
MARRISELDPEASPAIRAAWLHYALTDAPAAPDERTGLDRAGIALPLVKE